MSLAQHLEKLTAFRIVAETGKLREAAGRLNLTQPSLTRLIQTLEDSTGQKLFHRSRQGVELTAAGNSLFEFSKFIQKNLEDFEERLKNPEKILSGLIKIGSYESLAEYFWPDFVAHLKKECPEIKLSITTHSPARYQKAIEEGLLDLLVDAEPRLFGEVTSWVLYDDRFNFYGRKASIPPEVTTEEARNLTLIYCPQACDENNKSILRHLEENGYFFREKIELDSFTSVATFGEKGLGVAVLPQRLASSYVSSKRISHISLKGFPMTGFGRHSICATTRSVLAEDKRIRLVIKMLKAWFKT